MKFLKKLSSLTLALLISIGAFSFSASAAPTAISTYEQLCAISENLSGDYYLSANIVAPASTDFLPIGSSVDSFTGTLDGRGFSISGLNIKAQKSGQSSYGGLFASNAGTIKNLKVSANVSATGTNYSYVGIISAVNDGNIENCYTAGRVENSEISVAAYAGGVAGTMRKGNISNTASYASVHNGRGQLYTGGIVGKIDNGSIEKCSVYGSIFANGVDTMMDSYTGGICGFSNEMAVFKNCLVAGGIVAEKCANAYLGGISGTLNGGEVTACVVTASIMPAEILSHTYIGGITGYSQKEPSVSDSYYLSGIITEEITENYGTEVEKDASGKADSFPGLDFTNTWKLDGGKLILTATPEPPITESVSKLTGIKIAQKPKKLNYVQGDPSLDLRGMVVNAVYTDKTVALKGGEYTVGGYNPLKTGKQTVTIGYMGFSDSFTVKVKKTTESVITSDTITEGSYSDGDSNGVEIKPEDLKPESAKPQQKPSTDDSIENSQGNAQFGGNAVVDTLDSSSSDVPQKEDDKKVETETEKENKDGKKPLNISPLLYMIINIVVIIVLAAIAIVAVILVVFFILKRKTAAASDINEISNEELAEISPDQKDID